MNDVALEDWWAVDNSYYMSSHCRNVCSYILFSLVRFELIFIYIFFSLLFWSFTGNVCMSYWEKVYSWGHLFIQMMITLTCWAYGLHTDKVGTVGGGF